MKRYRNYPADSSTDLRKYRRHARRSAERAASDGLPGTAAYWRKKARNG